MTDYTLPTSEHERRDMQRKLEHLGIDCSKGLAAGFAQFCSRFDCQATAPWKSLNDLGGTTFAEVFQFELDALDGDVPEGPAPANLADVYRRAHARMLTGLAFSGGGIRSATFNLGIVQALAELRLLKDFDYLSTVSGGGYIGGWLSKWIHHLQGDVAQVEGKLAGKTKASTAAPADADPATALPRGEPRPVQYLRRYSNYLTPRTGLFSADTWTVICTYARNTLLNMTILVAWLSVLFLLPRVLLPVLEWLRADFPLWPAAIAVFLLSVASMAFSISRKDPRPWRGWGLEGQNAVLVGVCLPLVVAGVLGSLAVDQVSAQLAAFWRNLPDSILTAQHSVLLLPGLCYFLAWGLGWGGARLLNRRDARAARADAARRRAEEGTAPAAEEEPAPEPPRHRAVLEWVVHLLSAAIALAAGSVLLLKAVALVEASPYAAPNIVRLATFGMPVMLSLFGITITLMIGLVGRMYRDESREWWARQGAWTFICALAWLGLFASTFYLPPLLDWAWSTYVTTTAIAAALSTLLTMIGLKAGSGKSTGREDAPKWKDVVAMIAPYAFSVLAIALLTTFLQWLVAPVDTVRAAPPIVVAPPAAQCPAATPRCGCDGAACKDDDAAAPISLARFLEQYTDRSSVQHGCRAPAVRPTPPPPLDVLPVCWAGPISPLALLIGCALAGLVLAWRVDINKFSLYMMYRLRLVRAYFGASTPARAPHPFTGFDPQDDPPLADLLRRRPPPDPPPGDGKAVPVRPGALQRPYHLLNAAVNLVGGKELAWQHRKAGNFLFSPAFCGFELPDMPPPDNGSPQLRGAYRPTGEYAAKESWLRDDDAGVKLGMAVAVSGAAASPNMGYHTSLPLAFLMTLFNLRLGRWSPNPMRQDWRRPAPRVGLASLLSELLGLTDATARFLYLSDGGHFENLGIYELVRRRCRLIIAVDASADTDYAFEDLGNAVRKCLTDFNVPIELKPGEMRRIDKDNRTAACFVQGTIHYRQADGDCPDGVLLYIKPTIVGDENADLLNYAKLHADFPHQSTADQWFDENQFESYRILGYRAGLAALDIVAKDFESGESNEPAVRVKRMVDKLKPKPAAAPGA